MRPPARSPSKRSPSSSASAPTSAECSWSTGHRTDGGFPEADKLTFVFDGGQLTTQQISQITPDPQEIAEYTFRNTNPAQLAQLVHPSLNRRITAAIAARTTPERSYLELGCAGR